MFRFLTLFTFLHWVCAVDIDANNPNNADPSPFPTSGNHPYTRSSDPWPTGIPTLPDSCDMYNPSDECFNALDAHAAAANNKGAYLYLDKNNRESSPVPTPHSSVTFALNRIATSATDARTIQVAAQSNKVN